MKTTKLLDSCETPEFSWRRFLEQETYTQEELDDAVRLLDGTPVTSAPIPRNDSGNPLDAQLWFQESEFINAVMWMQRYSAAGFAPAGKGFRLAKQTAICSLERIEERAGELLNPPKAWDAAADQPSKEDNGH